MKKQLYIFATVLGLLTGCSKENELKKSVMIYDDEFTDLPAYSEWGYNTFGAYYDRQVFISNDVTVPAKVIVSENVLSFGLYGHLGGYYYYDNSNSMNMIFKIQGLLPEVYTDLTLLNDTVFDLTNSGIQVFLFSADSLENPVNILSGELYFKRAQNLLVDKEQIEVILSGYFDFKALINDEPITISDGRFDVGIGPDNFYVY